jgi:hypothetical protein
MCSDTALREQHSLDDHQVGQREQGVQLRRVLLEAAIAQLPVAKKVLGRRRCSPPPAPLTRQKQARLASRREEKMAVTIERMRA